MRLITFGDSWTAGHGVEDDIFYETQAHPPYGNNFIQELRKMNSWPRWLSDKLEYTFVNFGICGIGNKKILEIIKEVITTYHVVHENKFVRNEKVIKDNDTIIIMFSYPYRDNLLPINAFNQFEKILKPYKHFYFNSFYPMFKNENFDTNLLPDYYINPNGCVADILKEYEIKNDVSIWEYNKRSVWNDEKNFWEGDYHPNLLGYKIIAEYIYEEIKNKL